MSTVWVMRQGERAASSRPGDLAGIQAAIDYASLGDGGTVFFPPDTYTATSASSNIVMRDKVKLVGCGRGSILMDTNSLSIINLTGVDDFTIEGLAFTSSLAGSWVAGRGAIWADVSDDATRGIVSGCFINGVNTCGIAGTFTECRFIGNDIRSTEEHGIYLSFSSDCIVSGNTLNTTGLIGSGAQAGIKLADTVRTTVSGNIIVAPEHEGIMFESGTIDCVAAGNTIRDCPQRSIRFNTGSSKCAVIGNACVNATLASIRLFGGDDHLVASNMLDSGSGTDPLITIDAGVTDTQVLNNSCITTVVTPISDSGTRTVLVGNKTNSIDGYYQLGSDVNLATGKVVRVNGTAVLGAQGAAVADADGTLADATTKLNALLARLRTHGLIAT